MVLSTVTFNANAKSFWKTWMPHANIDKESSNTNLRLANEALLRDYDLTEIIKSSKTLSQRSILTISDMKDKLLNRIMHADELLGVKSQYFNFFNKTLGGLRKGELTLVTGASGSGKTTFLSQLSIDFLT
jgi:twinkle protein